jgi:hypothetical protein
MNKRNLTLIWTCIIIFLLCTDFSIIATILKLTHVIHIAWIVIVVPACIAIIIFLLFFAYILHKVID